VFDDDRGCDFANAAVELAETDHPARRVIEEIKTEHRNRLANSAGGRDRPGDLLPILCPFCLRAPASAGKASASKDRARNSCACARRFIASFQNTKSEAARSDALAAAV